MYRVDVERWTCHRLGDAKTAREALHERGFANAQISVQCERNIRRELTGQLFSERAHLPGGGGAHTFSESLEDVHPLRSQSFSFSVSGRSGVRGRDKRQDRSSRRFVSPDG